MAARTRGLRRLALVVGGVLVGLGLGEVALRLVAPQPTGVRASVLDPDLIAANAPGAEGHVTIPGVYSHRYAHDAEGRRRTTGDTLADAPEVLVLGDSFAYGMGVEDAETLASRLADGLRQRSARVRVRNGAVAGKGPAYALRLLQTRGADWRPDVAVYLFYPNDFVNVWRQTYFAVGDSALTPREPDGRWIDDRIRITGHPVYQRVLAHSHLASLLWQVGLRAVGDNSPPNTDMDTLRAPRPWAFEGAVEPTAQMLAGLRDELAARGAPLVLAYAPTAAELAEARRGGEPSVDAAQFAAIRARLGVDAVDLTPALLALDRPVGALYFPETHWRPVAHATAARALLDPVHASLCARDLSRPGCRTAPEAVRTIAEMRAATRSAGSGRRSPAD